MAERRQSEKGQRKPGRETRPEERLHIDLGFGDLFKGLGNIIDLVDEMAREGKSEVSGTRETQGPGGVRGVYGFSVKMGLGGTPVVEHFGNMHAADGDAQVDEVREPLVDVFDESDHVLVIAELPGIAQSDIKLEIKDDILSLSAEGGGRKYAKEILLPASVKPAGIRQKYQSGILEIRLEKTK